jgi:hypothetical protein
MVFEDRGRGMKPFLFIMVKAIGNKIAFDIWLLFVREK